MSDDQDDQGVPDVDPIPAGPGADFAAMMASAAHTAAGESAEEAPYGWTKDRSTGAMRPKKAPGRGGVRSSPSLAELQDARASEQGQGDEQGRAPDEPAPDRAPAKRTRRQRRATAAAAQGSPGPQVPPAAQLPPYRPGVIARGMDKLYRKTGRLVRVMDHDIGSAIIDATIKVDEDDVTVGEAWEELARTNPRVRALLLRLIAGGAVGGVVMAHAPILLAIAMKEPIRKHIPFMALIQALLTDDAPDGAGGAVPSDLSEQLGGIQAEDLQQMMTFAQGLMGGIAARPGASPRVPTGMENVA